MNKIYEPQPDRNVREEKNIHRTWCKHGCELYGAFVDTNFQLIFPSFSPISFHFDSIVIVVGCLFFFTCILLSCTELTTRKSCSTQLWVIWLWQLNAINQWLNAGLLSMLCFFPPCSIDNKMHCAIVTNMSMFLWMKKRSAAHHNGGNRQLTLYGCNPEVIAGNHPLM